MHRRRSISPRSLARILIKNRRKRYLDTHPEYLDSPSLELADPLGYDRLIRRFQSSSQREAEGRKKGYSGVLEADLWRSEAKMEALREPDHAAKMRYRRDEKGQIVAEEKDEVPSSKEDGAQRWKKEMELRFLRGDDGEFDYEKVDGNEAYDDHRTFERDEQERWFDEEEPQWTITDKGTVDSQNGDNSPHLVGQTGVQDF
ncbi:MAG: hypothetical protein Q9217_002873 [Psora testacea]